MAMFEIDTDSGKIKKNGSIMPFTLNEEEMGHFNMAICGAAQRHIDGK